MAEEYVTDAGIESEEDVVPGDADDGATAAGDVTEAIDCTEVMAESSSLDDAPAAKRLARMTSACALCTRVIGSDDYLFQREIQDPGCRFPGSVKIGGKGKEKHT